MTLIKTRYGDLNVIEQDNVISKSLRMYGEWAQCEIELLRHFIKQGTVVVDVGAFIGTHARAFSMFVGPSGAVVAFEPRAISHSILVGNAKLSPIANIRVVNLALGSTGGSISVKSQDLQVDDNFGASAISSVDRKESSVEVIGIATLDEFDLERVSFMKIDVEGMEHKVLLGARRTVDRCRPVIFAETNSLEASAPLLQWARESGYTAYGVLSPAYNAANFNAGVDNIFGNSQEAGLLLIPQCANGELESVARGLNLAMVSTIDDLALLLLHKPQYPHEVLEQGNAASVLSISYPSARSRALDQEVTELKYQLGALGSALSERDAAITGHLQAAREQDGRIANLEHSVNEVGRRNADLAQAIAERDATVAARTQTLAVLEGEVAALGRDLIGRDARIAYLERSAAESATQTAALAQAVSERDASIAQLNQALEQKTYTIREIHRSTSWRVTWPLRLLGTALRRLARGAARFSSSDIRMTYSLLKHQLVNSLRNPAKVKSKLMQLGTTWRTGGYAGVVNRMRRVAISTPELRPPVPSHRGISVELLTEQLAGGPPVQTALLKLPPQLKVCIVILMERDLVSTARCIESVVRSSNTTPYKIIVVSDGPPEGRVDGFIESYAATVPHLQVINNRKPRGRLHSAILGVESAGDADVVLLGGEAEVANDWLDRLVSHAYADPRIGTVIPFSNKAGPCAYPYEDGWSSLPGTETVGNIDKACSSANFGSSVEISGGFGVCVYLKEGWLLRAIPPQRRGIWRSNTEDVSSLWTMTVSDDWKHVLAPDIFVASHSFNQQSDDQNGTSLQRISENILPYRAAVTATRYRMDQRPVVLFITHTYGGGTEKHVQELSRSIDGIGGRVLILRPSSAESGAAVTLETYDRNDGLNIPLSSRNMDMLGRALKSFGVGKVHVHHTIGYSLSVEELVLAIGLPYDVTIHDFYTICPLINLRTAGKGYCGSPTTDDCNACLSLEPARAAGIEITWWRARYGSLLNGAQNVYCPSTDTAKRIVARYPAAPVSIVPHERLVLPLPRRSMSGRTFRRFAILGVLASHKGLGIIEETVAAIEKAGLPLEFHLIGYPERPLRTSKVLTQTGPYKDAELADLIERADPDAILFPVQWPETYSYTLTAAMLSGRPVVVANLGSLPERVSGLANAHVYPFRLSGLELAKFLLELQLAGVDTQDAPMGTPSHA